MFLTKYYHLLIGLHSALSPRSNASTINSKSQEGSNSKRSKYASSLHRDSFYGGLSNATDSSNGNTQSKLVGQAFTDQLMSLKKNQPNFSRVASHTTINEEVGEVLSQENAKDTTPTEEVGLLKSAELQNDSST